MSIGISLLMPMPDCSRADQLPHWLCNSTCDHHGDFAILIQRGSMLCCWQGYQCCHARARLWYAVAKQTVANVSGYVALVMQWCLLLQKWKSHSGMLSSECSLVPVHQPPKYIARMCAITQNMQGKNNHFPT